MTHVRLLESDVGLLESDVGLLESDVGLLESDVGLLESDIYKNQLKTMLDLIEWMMSDRSEKICYQLMIPVCSAYLVSPEQL